MDETRKLSLEQIREFLAGAEGVRFEGRDRAGVYGWVGRTLAEHYYGALKKPEKGLVKRYVEKMTGLSGAQVDRLVASYQGTGKVEAKPYQRRKFASTYTAQDIGLLADVDKEHQNLNGLATKRILERAYYDYGQAAYERIAKISVAHLYRLRKTAIYRKRNMSYQPTRPVFIAIGERRRPEPNGMPGYLRIDTVHQGDFDGAKGVYHINVVDQVTQWQVMAATPKISEFWLIPVIEALLAQFPFRLRSFHSDNGSEYINYDVSKMLGNLLIEQTKSRPRHSNDNGLVEAKNGAVIRKHMGHGYIEAQQAGVITAFYDDYMNPYVNFHRPCGVPEPVHLGKGKIKTRYRRAATPFELFAALPDCEQFLRPGTTLDQLKLFESKQSDTEAARAMQEAKAKLFAHLARRIA